VTDRLIRITTALAVVAVAAVAAVISYQHAFELVRSHGESGVTARLVPFTVDGLIWAASMVVLDASRRSQPVPRLAAWSLGAGIVATVGANLAHGVGHGPVGALVSAWPALALVGSFELLMMLIRTRRGTRAGNAEPELPDRPAPGLAQDAPLKPPAVPTLEQTVRARHQAGTVSAPSPANSTSTAARSSASSTKRHNSADRPGKPVTVRHHTLNLVRCRERRTGARNGLPVRDRRDTVVAASSRTSMRSSSCVERGIWVTARLVPFTVDGPT
jgi:hypothetical protein